MLAQLGLMVQGSRMKGLVREAAIITAGKKCNMSPGHLGSFGMVLPLLDENAAGTSWLTKRR